MSRPSDSRARDIPQRAPVRSLIVAIPADHALSLDRITDRLPAAEEAPTDVIVACAGQPSDLPNIHTHLPAAQFLIAPAGTSGEELRTLGLARASGDIVTLVNGVRTASPPAPDAAARRTSESAAPRLSIVVPVRDSALLLQESLAAIVASNLARDSYELIVVDDASTDGSTATAARYADTVIRLTGQRRGFAYARNRGAECARSGVIAFVGANVRVSPGTLGAAMQRLAEGAGVAAVGASCDGTSASRGAATAYWNLLQQYAATSDGGLDAHYAGDCIVVRRTAFAGVGMYNEWLFPVSSIEDLELGHRLQSGGHRVVLSKDNAVTMLGRRSAAAVLNSAWTQSMLMARTLGYPGPRTHSRGHVVHLLGGQKSLVIVALALLVLAAAIATTSSWQITLIVVAALLLLPSFGVLRYLAQRRGLAFAIASAPLHTATLLCVSAGLTAGWVLRHVIGDPAPDAATQAFAEVGVEMWPPVPRKP